MNEKVCRKSKSKPDVMLNHIATLIFLSCIFLFAKPDKCRTEK
jgi:hypothetical protein